MAERTVKVLSKQQLQRLNAKAIRGRASRTLKPEMLKRLPDSVVIPITSTLLHNDRDVRCHLVLDETGRGADLDMTLDDYNALVSVTVDPDTREVRP